MSETTGEMDHLTVMFGWDWAKSPADPECRSDLASDFREERRAILASDLSPERRAEALAQIRSIFRKYKGQIIELEKPFRAAVLEMRKAWDVYSYMYPVAARTELRKRGLL